MSFINGFGIYDDGSSGSGYPFPNENVDPKIKGGKKFGLQVARAIYAKSFATGSYYSVWQKIRENRRYATGQQDVNQYKKTFGAGLETPGDSSWLNLNWDIHSVAPKFVDVIVGGMINQDTKLQFNAIDPLSKKKKNEKRDEFYGKYMQSKTAQQLEQDLGVPLVSTSGFSPESEEDIEMYMEMEYKQPVEIAFEELTEWVLEHNDWWVIEKQVVRDLVENNFGGVRLYYDENNNIRMRYVDIEQFISSYVDRPDYSDADYYGEVYLTTIRDLRQRTNFPEEVYFELAKRASTKYSNPVWRYGNTYDGTRVDFHYDDYRVEVLDFLFYTTDVHVYEEKQSKYGGIHFNMKDYGYEAPKESKYNKQKVQKDLEVEYEGVWVTGTNYIQYGRAKNEVRPRKNGRMYPKLQHKYIMFQPNIKDGKSISIVDRIKPFIDDMQLDVLHMRHIKAEVAPPGVAIDIDALADTSDGAEGIDWKDRLNLWKQKGILLYSSTNDMGDPTQSRPLQEMMNGFGAALQPYFESYQFNLQQIREVTGINEARDASSPDAKTLVGVQKLQLLNSNNATRELYLGYTEGIFKRTGECIARMVRDKIKFDPNGIKEYENVVGEMAIKSLDWVNDMYMCDMGIVTQPLPTDQEIEQLNIDISTAQQNGDIRLEDAMQIRRIPNVKLAERFLMMRRKKYQQEMMQEQAMKEQMVAEREKQAALAAAEAEQIKQSAKLQTESQLKEIEWKLKQQEMMLAHEQEMQQIDRENYWKIKQIEEVKDREMDDNLINRSLDSADKDKESLPGAGVTNAGDAPRIVPHPAQAATRGPQV